MAGCPAQVLVSLGAGAESFRRPFFAKYLPGVVIKHNKDLECNSVELLLRFNDSNQTRIISLHRREVRLPGTSKSLVADVHFQAAILKIADASGDVSSEFKYTSLGKAALHCVRGAPQALQINVDGTLGDTPLRIMLEDQDLERLRRRGAFKLLSGLEDNEAEPAAAPKKARAPSKAAVPSKSVVSIESAEQSKAKCVVPVDAKGCTMPVPCSQPRASLTQDLAPVCPQESCLQEGYRAYESCRAYEGCRAYQERQGHGCDGTAADPRCRGGAASILRCGDITGSGTHESRIGQR